MFIIINWKYQSLKVTLSLFICSCSDKKSNFSDRRQMLCYTEEIAPQYGVC